MSRRLACLSALVLTLAGCAKTTAFSTTFPTRPDQLEATLARAKAAADRAEPAVIVGVTEAPHQLFAYDLASEKMLFRVPSEATALPFVAGSLIVVPETSGVSVVRLRDGSRVHRIAYEGMRLVGADGDAGLSAIVLSNGGSLNVRSRLVLLEGETVSADQTVARALGVPAVLGAVAFVPHNRVHLSAIDARGRELARVRIQDDVASEAFVRGSEVYFGQHGVYRLDGDTARGAADGAHVFRPGPRATLPGNPPLLRDSTASPPALESALHKVSLSFVPAAPAPGQSALTLADDALYLTFYRQVFALTPDGASAHWVHETESDIVGVRAISGGFFAVERSGVVTSLDAQGRVRRSLQLGVVPAAARIRAEHDGGAKASGEPPGLAEALARAAQNVDARLVPSRAFAAALLGKVPGEEAARALVGLCDVPSAPRVQEAACGALAQRSESSEAALAALARHGSFLDGTHPPPVGPLARNALNAGDRRAVPLLVAHLRDPATPARALPSLLEALGGLGAASDAGAVATFARLYHAEAGDETLDGALEAALTALVKLDPAHARGVLEWVVSDAHGRAAARAVAARQLAALAPAPTEPPQEASTPAEPSSQPTEEASTAADAPAQLTTQHIDEALSPVRTKLARCVRDAPERPASARLLLVIAGSGELLEVRTLPASVQSCVDPLVRGTSFPATKYDKRSVMSYTVPR